MGIAQSSSRHKEGEGADVGLLIRACSCVRCCDLDLRHRMQSAGAGGASFSAFLGAHAQLQCSEQVM